MTRPDVTAAARERTLAWLWGVLVAGLLAACSSPSEPPLARGATVVVLGDSISAGYGLTPEQSWVAHLGVTSGWKMVNGGVSGDTSAQGLARLPALLEEHRPAAVLIELGGNDFLRKQSVPELRANLAAIAGLVRQAGSRPVLVAVPAPSIAGAALRSLSDHEVYRSLADEMKLPLVDEAVSGVLSKPEWKLDALHPNADGHRELAARVAKKLRGLGLLK
jgi:lysophospholipase L1-like esterase